MYFYLRAQLSHIIHFKHSIYCFQVDIAYLAETEKREETSTIFSIVLPTGKNENELLIYLLIYIIFLHLINYDPTQIITEFQIEDWDSV